MEQNINIVQNMLNVEQERLDGMKDKGYRKIELSKRTWNDV